MCATPARSNRSVFYNVFCTLVGVFRSIQLLERRGGWRKGLGPNQSASTRVIACNTIERLMTCHNHQKKRFFFNRKHFGCTSRELFLKFKLDKDRFNCACAFLSFKRFGHFFANVGLSDSWNSYRNARSKVLA